MAKSKKKDPPSAQEQAKQIVTLWRKTIKAKLKPWFLERKVFTKLEPKLRTNIIGLIEGGQPFTAADRRNSLRVAKDCARICKILQPPPFPKKIGFDTFQLVLELSATQHRVCQGGRGAGGWCDIGG
jgi:hypothetical protein